MSALKYTIRQLKYFSVAFVAAIVLLALGGLFYQDVASYLGVPSYWVAFGIFMAWFIGCNRYNAYLNATARAQRMRNTNGRRLSDEFK